MNRVDIPEIVLHNGLWYKYMADIVVMLPMTNPLLTSVGRCRDKVAIYAEERLDTPEYNP